MAARAPATRCRIACAWSRKSSPAGVSSMPLEVRSRSVRPSSCSRRPICCDRADWVMYTSSAARPKWPWRTTAAKYSSWRNSIPSHPTQSTSSSSATSLRLGRDPTSLSTGSARRNTISVGIDRTW